MREEKEGERERERERESRKAEGRSVVGRFVGSAFNTPFSRSLAEDSADSAAAAKKRCWVACSIQRETEVPSGDARGQCRLIT